MFRQSLILGLVLGIASVANGQTWIELAPQTPGPYAPSASVDVDVILHNMEGIDLEPRLLTLDWSNSDAALTLPGTFHFQFRRSPSFMGISDLFQLDLRLVHASLAGTNKRLIFRLELELLNLNLLSRVFQLSYDLTFFNLCANLNGHVGNLAGP